MDELLEWSGIACCLDVVKPSPHVRTAEYITTQQSQIN